MNRTTPPRLGLVEAKAAAVAAIAKGETVEAAMQAVGRSPKTWEMWRSRDKVFAAEVDRVRADRADAKERGKDPDLARMGFEEFRKVYLGRETYDHQRAWICALEGRELDEGLPGEFELNNARRLLINTPPGHSKSTVITVEYVVYRLCMNPDTHVVIVGKTQEKAKKFLHSIKQRLTDSRWSKLQADFAPEGGFKQPNSKWTSSQIYLGQPVASEEKDPSVEAIGIRGDLQGARAQLMILDDAVDMQNAHLWESQKAWLDDIVQSRLYNGKLILVGTRAAAQDLYAALMDGTNYLSGRSQWSRLKQPAVLSFAEDPKDWVTLWPRSTQPYDPDDTESVPGEDGLYPAFDGEKLDQIRGTISASKWSFLYQQEEAAEDATFKAICVHGSADGRRSPGPLRGGMWGGPRAGKEGMYTIAAMDPAMGGGMAVVVGSVDRETQKRWIENVFIDPGSAAYIRSIIKSVTIEYQVHEWMIEKNAFQGFLTDDPEIRKFLNSRGVLLTPHYTGGFNKLDPDIGVSAMSGLFGSTRRIHDGAGREVHNGDNLVELPNPEKSEGVKGLIAQLLTWVPNRRGKDLKQDAVMALWFFEIASRKILGYGRENAPTIFRASKFATRAQVRRREIRPQYVMGGGVDG